jgi:hypothetical protein
VVGLVYRKGRGVLWENSLCVCVCLSGLVIDHCVCVPRIPGALVLCCRLLPCLCRDCLLIGYAILIVPQYTLIFRLRILPCGLSQSIITSFLNSLLFLCTWPIVKYSKRRPQHFGNSVFGLKYVFRWVWEKGVIAIPGNLKSINWNLISYWNQVLTARSYKKAWNKNYVIVSIETVILCVTHCF